VGEYWLASSDRQVVNTLYREFPLTVFQLVERFGREAVSPPVREQYDAGTWDREVRPSARIPTARRSSMSTRAT